MLTCLAAVPFFAASVASRTAVPARLASSLTMLFPALLEAARNSGLAISAPVPSWPKNDVHRAIAPVSPA